MFIFQCLYLNLLLKEKKIISLTLLQRSEFNGCHGNVMMSFISGCLGNT